GYPVVKVLDDHTLVFPDYPGNGAFQSLGNIVENPHVGMLFIDFERAIRIRVNGTAQIVESIDDEEITSLFPGAQQYVVVSTEQVFGNCTARIPTLVRPQPPKPRS
ncbi:MAG: pyridoxamine 5'-phosphate oxidase family protein, partial [Tumebacillaceae bacterium]